MAKKIVLCLITLVFTTSLMQGMKRSKDKDLQTPTNNKIGTDEKMKQALQQAREQVMPKRSKINFDTDLIEQSNTKKVVSRI